MRIAVSERSRLRHHDTARVMADNPRPPSGLAYSWPAFVFAAALVLAFIRVWYDTPFVTAAAWVCLVGAFFPCCLIRDWWVNSKAAR